MVRRLFPDGRVWAWAQSTLPHVVNLFFPRRSSLSNENMPCLFLASLDFHELVKFKHPSLAAWPSFATLMKDRMTGMVDTFLLLSRDSGIVYSFTPFSPAGRIWRYLERWVVWFRLWRGGACSIWWRGNRRWKPRLEHAAVIGSCHRSYFRSRAFRKRAACFGSCCGRLLRFCGWGIIDGWVLASRAGRNDEEFIEGQDTGFAAFPPWTANSYS